MPNKKKPGKIIETPSPKKFPEIKPIDDPDEETVPDEKPIVKPDEEPDDPVPYEIPPSREGL
jgi:hypothetical protein